MGPHIKEESTEPPPITPGGTYSIQTVTVGCKVYIRRQNQDGSTEERLAEILSIRERRSNNYATRRRQAGADTVDEQVVPEDKWEYFVHWDQFNKRLDDWVSGSRLVLTRDLEWPRPKAPPTTKKAPGQKILPGKILKGSHKKTKLVGGKPPPRLGGGKPVPPEYADYSTPTPAPQTPGYEPSVPSTPSFSIPQKRKASDDEDESLFEDVDAEGEMDIDADAEADADADADADPDADADGDADGEADADGEVDGEVIDLTASTPIEPPVPLSHFSKEQEIEKLRTSGSMTQSISEIARVKNLNRLQIGKHEVDAWYFSPYPQDYAHLPTLFICEFCLSYFPSPLMLGRHRTRCTLLHPPGNEIYRHEDISFFELDGKRQLTWCRNLSLLSKCFLDHKTLYYDVTPFMYYVMCQRDLHGCHIIGYFSKEKESADSYNVACILTLPQHQRHGYGKILIEFSYELSKKEGKLGSPEKPLSDLGLLSYRAYWAETIIDLLRNTTEDLSIDDIAQKTSITHADVMNTCTTLQLFKHHKGQHVICLSDAILERHEKAKSKRRRRIHPECLVWKPPVFTRDQLRFGW